jgi:hypothetical protein
VNEIIVGIAKKQGRVHFFEEWALNWSKVQNNGYRSSVLKGLVRANNWPSVVKIFYHSKIQNGLAKSIRWQSRANLAINKKIYVQSSLNHVISFCFLGNNVLAKANGSIKPPLDKELLLKAFMIHNLPKGLGLSDVPYEKKHVSHDIDEYRMFKKFIAETAAPADWQLLEQIYLLQFCYSDIGLWPVAAKKLMADLKQRYWQEIVWFRFIEHLDYLFYGVEQYVHFNNRQLIAKIAAEQVPLINSLKKENPILGLVWTEAASDYFKQFII